MSWFKKKKPAPPPAKPSLVKPSRADIIAQARANMRGARERIGEEEIQRIAKALFSDPGSDTKH